MESISEREDDDALNAWVGALTRGGSERPESRHLDPFVGRWTATSEWEPVPGRGVRVSTLTVDVRWVLAGRLLEMTSRNEDGDEASRLLIAFDPSRGDFAAFGASILSTHFEVERGWFDEDRRALVLDAVEHAPALGLDIHIRRTLQMVGDDEFVIDISYPADPPGTYGPMRVSHRRVS